MANTEINFYKQINDQVTEEAGIKYELPSFSFVSKDGELVEMLDTDETGDNIVVQDDSWTPQENNLIYEQRFHIEHPGELFGRDKVNDSANKLGIAVHVYSRSSFFQETIACDGDIYDTDEEITVAFKHVFPKASLRGKIALEFFFYLKDFQKRNQLQASFVGTNLSQSHIYRVVLHVDGDAPLFPITQRDVPGGPLWTVKKLWTDPSVEMFDLSTVQIELNSAHPLIEQVDAGKTRLAVETLSNIIIESMGMIIAQTLADMKEQELSFDDECAEGSIASVVEQWITLHDVDTTNIMTIMSSLKNSDLKDYVATAGDEEDGD